MDDAKRAVSTWCSTQPPGFYREGVRRWRQTVEVPRDAFVDFINVMKQERKLDSFLTLKSNYSGASRIHQISQNCSGASGIHQIPSSASTAGQWASRSSANVPASVAVS
ncbi:hypothetical protein M514_06314 [Trichuris suis]|uniref:Uncharacterized protein n=1 Tax=Trichuris suis TaxID=68888 RepID=A0A085N637_9BILA|nr:hypothetical protein M513_06314 [Trichuris suis]KFD64933.1 hypothetical protein M514_06314 [Trichuris suis]